MLRLARSLGAQGSFYAAVIALVVFAAFPFYWMLITTFKADGDLYDLKSIPYWFNTAPTLEHIEYLFAETLFVQWLANSALIGLCVVVITLLVALPAGYSFVFIPARTAETLGIGIFLTYLVPPTLLFLPLSRVVSLLGLQDTLWSLVVVYPTFTIPFCTWLFMGFFKSVPREIEEPDGRSADRQRSGGHRLQSLPRPVRQRHHRRCRQVTARHVEPPGSLDAGRAAVSGRKPFYAGTAMP